MKFEGEIVMWKLFAVLSAVFAAATSILAKMGMRGVSSNLATAIRTVVILLLSWGIIFSTGEVGGIKDLTKQNWLFLILSGVATGLSWIFYFHAVQIGDVSKVAPIDKMSVVITMILAFLILGEKASWSTIIGGILIAAGSLIMLIK